MTLIRAKNIGKYFLQRKIISNVSFDINKGEILGIIGQNGSGKTVLLKMIAGLYQADEGDIYLNDEIYRPFSPINTIQKGIGYIPQFNYLDISLTIHELVKPLKLDITKYLDLFNLKIKNKNKLCSFDDIIIQIIECCIVFARNSKLLILDEPLFHDSNNIHYWNIIKDYCNLNSITIVLVSHNASFTIRNSDKLLLLKEDGSLFIKNCKEKALITERVISFLDTKVNESYNSKNDVTTKHISKENLAKYVSNIIQSNERGICLFFIENHNLTKIIENVIQSVILNHKNIKGNNIHVLPSHLTDRGLSLDCSVFDNLISFYNLKSDFQLINRKKYMKAVKKQLFDFNINPNDPQEYVKNLSGGNKQKLAYLKLILLNKKNNILIEPFRGLDIKSTTFFKVHLNDSIQDNKIHIIITTSTNDIIDLNVKNHFTVT